MRYAWAATSPGASTSTAASTTPASTTARSTQVDLAWPAATDNVAVTGYRLERCTGAGCTTFTEIATPTGLTASDPGRTASTTYRYRVRASDAAGNLGAYSPIASVTTPAAADTTPPGAPASLTATASSATQVDLAWPAATDNVAVTGYRLERCTGAGCTTFTEIATPTGLTASDPGRTASTTYRYQVRASDAAGNLGAYSPIASVTTPAAADTTPPGAPASLTATASSATQVDLAWPAATDNVAVTGYRLERCTGAGCTTFTEIATPTGLTASDPGRTASTTYRYQVRASDAAGNLGAYSPIASVTTPAVQPPPTGLVAAYAFDETAGTTAGDASGNTNTGTLQTGAGWTAAGHAGGALVLDGSSGRVRVPASSSLGLTSAMTLEAWIAVGRPGRLADHPAARDRRLLPEREQRHRCPASVGRRHVRGHDRLRDRHDGQSGRGLDPCRADLRRGDPAPVRQRHARHLGRPDGHHPGQPQPALDRRQQPLRRVLRGQHR